MLIILIMFYYVNTKFIKTTVEETLILFILKNFFADFLI